MVADSENIVLKTGISKSPINPDLNFRLRLDIAGANIRIADKIITNEATGQFYVDRESGLDMDFDIVKVFNKQWNESRITIWNLSDSTYSEIANKSTAFELYGAWSNDEYALMFRGYPKKFLKQGKTTILTANKGFLKQDANADRRGQNDIPTILTLVDGKISYEDATINKEYKNGVSTEVILKDCIESLGVPIGTMAEIEHITKKNYTARGKTVNVLNHLASMLDFNWCVTNDVFYLFTDEVPAQPYGILLNSGNSSTPERQNDKFKVKTTTIQRANKKKGIAGKKQVSVQKIDNGYMIRTELLPFLNPGVFCGCDFGELLQGTKFIYKVRHRGNNYGTVATTEVYVA